MSTEKRADTAGVDAHTTICEQKRKIELMELEHRNATANLEAELGGVKAELEGVKTELEEVTPSHSWGGCRLLQPARPGVLPPSHDFALATT